MEIDHNGLEVLGRAESLRLMATQNAGRVGLSVHALPVIFTVNFALDGDDVVFRSRPGTKLTAALAGNVVCFQADRLDPDGHYGWSVVITGQALIVDEDAPRLNALNVPNWLGESHWIRVSADVVSGRRRSPATSRLDLRHSEASSAQSYRGDSSVAQ